MHKFSEHPLYLIMNPKSEDAHKAKKIPYFLYDYPYPDSGFKKTDFTLATEESERISVEHVAKALDPNAKNSALS